MKPTKCTLFSVASLLSLLLLAFSPKLTRAQTLTPTFESIGVELLVSNVNSNSVGKVRFREEGGEWRDGLDLYVDRYTDRKGFRGSIVLLRPNTKYEVELRYAIDGSSFQTKTASVSTWDEEFPVAETVPIKDRDDLLAKLKSGSPSQGYVVFDGGTDRALIDAEGAASSVIKLENLEYVVLRNMRFTGSQKSAVRIVTSDHIVVEDCEIYQWGNNGTSCKNDNQRREGGIFVESSEQIVVQRNVIRDPNGNSCTWNTQHPSGPRGIAVAAVAQSVFRYNHVYSSSEDHYFADIFNGEPGTNAGEGGIGTESNVDVYGNEFSNAWDDGIEVEGRNMNIRVWNNAIHKVYQGVASDRNDRTYYGPLYVWRNIITDLSKSPSDTEGQLAGFKLDNGAGRGGIYLFNNTISGLNEFPDPYQGITNNHQYNFVMKNNIFEVTDKVFRNNGNLKPSSGDLNHNAYSDEKSKIVNRSDWNDDWETNGQFGVDFSYQKGENEWDYYVQGSGQGAGTRIPNFIDPPAGTAIDLGAAQAGVWSLCVGPNADCANTDSPPPPPVDTDSILAYRATITDETADFPDERYWADAPLYQFTDPTGESDNEVEIKAVWDDQYLMIGVYVNDDVQLSRNDAVKPWKNDAFDILLDPKNTRSSTWDTVQGHRQVIFNVGGRQYIDPTSFTVESLHGSGGPNHYFHEVRIPWSSLPGVTPAQGVSLGLDVANHDRDAADQKTQFSYTGRTNEFRTPSQFATLVLGASPSPATSPTPVSEDNMLRQLTVYPNPLSGGAAYLRLSGFDQAQVQITDLRGQVVYQAAHDKSQTELSYPLPPGLYVVRVSDAQGTLSEKLIVE